MRKTNSLNKITASYSEQLIDTLKNRNQAKLYLQAALEAYQLDDHAEAFLLALRHVAQAQGGIAKLAEKTQLNRETLYRTLSAKGNPRLQTLSVLLHALGFELTIT